MRNPLGSGGTLGANGGKRCQRVVSLYLILNITQYSITNNNTKHNRRKLLCGKDLGRRGVAPPVLTPYGARTYVKSSTRDRQVRKRIAR